MQSRTRKTKCRIVCRRRAPTMGQYRPGGCAMPRDGHANTSPSRKSICSWSSHARTGAMGQPTKSLRDTPLKRGLPVRQDQDRPDFRSRPHRKAGLHCHHSRRRGAWPQLWHDAQPQLDQMRAEGCAEVQGYFYSKPMPASEIAAAVRLPETSASGGVATGRERPPALAAGVFLGVAARGRARCRRHGD